MSSHFAIWQKTLHLIQNGQSASSLTGLDSCKQENLLIILAKENSKIQTSRARG